MDEMCRFYLMYATPGKRTLAKASCTSAGPPHYYWSRDPLVGPAPSDVERLASLGRRR